MDKEFFLFLDTKTFLHHTAFTEIDWPRLLGTNNIKIVVPPVTLRALHKEKAGKKIISKLKELHATKSYSVELLQMEGSIDWNSDAADFFINDDHFLSSILSFDRTLDADQNVILVTNDLVLQAKAHDKGIVFLELPENVALNPTGA